MPPGRQSKTLRPDEITRLSDFRIAHRLSFPQLALAMEAPFRWQTLKHALEGERIWDLNHRFLAGWIETHCPRKKATGDGKTVRFAGCGHTGVVQG